MCISDLLTVICSMDESVMKCVCVFECECVCVCVCVCVVEVSGLYKAGLTALATKIHILIQICR